MDDKSSIVNFSIGLVVNNVESLLFRYNDDDDDDLFRSILELLSISLIVDTRNK